MKRDEGCVYIAGRPDVGPGDLLQRQTEQYGE